MATDAGGRRDATNRRHNDAVATQSFEIKVRNHLHGVDLRPMTEAEARAYGIVPGYASAVGLDPRVRLIETGILHDRRAGRPCRCHIAPGGIIPRRRGRDEPD